MWLACDKPGLKFWQRLTDTQSTPGTTVLGYDEGDIMSVSFGGISPALDGMKTQARAFDRAAQRLAKSSLQDQASATAATADVDSVTETEQATASGGTDAAGVMTEAMLDMLLARRMHTANLQALQVAHDVLRDLVAEGAA